MESKKDSAIPCPMTHLKDFLMPSQTFLVSAVKFGSLLEFRFNLTGKYELNLPEHNLLN